MEHVHVYAHVYLCACSVLYLPCGPIIVTYAVHCRILRSDSTLIMSMLEKSSAEFFQCCGTISLSCLEESFFLCCVSVFSIYSVLCRVVLGLEVGIVDEDTTRCSFKNQRSLSHFAHSFQREKHSLISVVTLVSFARVNQFDSKGIQVHIVDSHLHQASYHMAPWLLS